MYDTFGLEGYSDIIRGERLDCDRYGALLHQLPRPASYPQVLSGIIRWYSLLS